MGPAPDAHESRLGFILNHLITDELPFERRAICNSDPVTGQAGWYDVRVRIRPADDDEPQRLRKSKPTHPVLPRVIDKA